MTVNTYNAFEFFIKRHKAFFAFCVTLQPYPPTECAADRRGKKLPTPYRVLEQWMKKNLSGEWATRRYKGCALVGVENQDDANLVALAFGHRKPLSKAPDFASCPQIRLTDSDYKFIAHTLGHLDAV